MPSPLPALLPCRPCSPAVHSLLLHPPLPVQVTRIETGGLTIQQILEQVQSRTEEMDTMQASPGLHHVHHAWRVVGSAWGGVRPKLPDRLALL